MASHMKRRSRGKHEKWTERFFNHLYLLSFTGEAVRCQQFLLPKKVANHCNEHILKLRERISGFWDTLVPSSTAVAFPHKFPWDTLTGS